MALVLKVHYIEETRRISLDKIPSYGELAEIVKQLFPSLEKFTLKYQDEDSDMITLSNDKDMIEALNVIGSGKVLRLTVFPANSSSSTSTSTSTSTDNTPKGNVNNNNSAQPNPFEGLFNPQMLAQFLQPQQLPQQTQQNTQQQQPQIPDFSNMFGNSSNGLPPMLQTVLQNPQMLQMIPALLPAFMPMISNYLQNAPPEQKAKIIQFLQSNPQLLMLVPQLLPILQGELSPQSPQPQQTAPQSSQDVPKSYTCDICENSITGVRYHCNTCGNFDLCYFCQTIPNIHEHGLTEHSGTQL